MEFEIIENEKSVKVIIKENEKNLANATCFWKNTPKIDGKNIGAIGEFEYEIEEAGIKVLNKCEEILKSKNVKTIVAPMNENTWKKYRTLKFSRGDDMFLLENVNPIEHNDLFIKAGFKELYTYTSTKGLIKDAYTSESLDIIEEKIKSENIKIRKFNKANYIEDLKKIYNISIKSFYRNPLYTDIKEEEFLKQYEQYIHMIDEDLILIAEKDNEEIGFVFSMPDYNELKNTGKINTIIVKTIAVIPEYEKLAIGNVMLRKISQIAKKKEYEKWIFAFMYSNNTSQKMAKRNRTEVIREYALYGKEIIA